MKILRYFIIIFIGFQLTSCDDVFPREEDKDRIVFTIEPRLDKDNNGLYHLPLNRSKWQTIHRISGHAENIAGSPMEFLRVTWSSNLYWYLGDTLGYIVQRGLTDDLIYVSYDTTHITGFSGMEVPTSNKASYSNARGEVNNMIAPVRIMVGDTMILRWQYFDIDYDLIEGNIGIVLE